MTLAKEKSIVLILLILCIYRLFVWYPKFEYNYLMLSNEINYSNK